MVGKSYEVDLNKMLLINESHHNTPANMCSEALIKLNQWRRKNHAQFKIVMTIHDSIIFDVPKEEI